MYRCCEHTDFIIGELHEDILWDEYGIISDLVVSGNQLPLNPKLIYFV
jgi:hypothetical protein